MITPIEKWIWPVKDVKELSIVKSWESRYSSRLAAGVHKIHLKRYFCNTLYECVHKALTGQGYIIMTNVLSCSDQHPSMRSWQLEIQE